MISTTACGKIILFGEHSVVYGKPAIAVPLKELRLSVKIEKSNDFIITSDVFSHIEELKEGVNKITKKLNVPNKLKLTVSSDIPLSSGFGSSAAFSVAVTKAVAKHFGITLNLKQIKEISYESENVFHGTASGLDNTVIAYEKSVYFVKGKEPEILHIKNSFSFIIVNIGIKSDTSEVVNELRERYDSNKENISLIFDEIESIVDKARTALEEGNISFLGELMDKNQKCLKRLGLSINEIDSLVTKLKDLGALGAKLSGAGKGGNVIALLPEEKVDEAKEKLREEGKEVFSVNIG
tara:strand:+ start:95 stop:979 length:885 start_codon:yes stop_codon:yes gene_type:complete